MKSAIKGVIRWAANTILLRWLWRLFRPVLNIGIAARNGLVIWYDDDRKKAFQLIQKVKAESDMLLQDNESYMIYQLAKRTGKLKGDIAEVGVYKGGSARLICAVKGKRPLHLFDTFEGLPELSKHDELFEEGDFSASYNEVKNYLKSFKNVYLYQGYFPQTGGPIKKKKFSFVHLDVDIYQSTKDSLAFFYPRMVKGGVILSHDYVNAEGVRKAFDEFFKNKPEVVLEATGSQCMVVKS